MTLQANHIFNRTVDDLSAQGNSGSEVNATYAVPNLRRSASDVRTMLRMIRLNGTDARVNGGFSFTAETEWTWFARVRISGTGTGFILGQHDGTNGVRIWRSGDTTMRLEVEATTGLDVTFLLDTWHYIFVTRSSGTITFYLDAVSEDTSVTVPTWPAVTPTIGAQANDTNHVEMDCCQFGIYDEGSSAASSNPTLLGAVYPDLPLNLTGAAGTPTYEEDWTNDSGAATFMEISSGAGTQQLHESSPGRYRWNQTNGNDQNWGVFLIPPAMLTGTVEFEVTYLGQSGNREHHGIIATNENTLYPLTILLNVLDLSNLTYGGNVISRNSFGGDSPGISGSNIYYGTAPDVTHHTVDQVVKYRIVFNETTFVCYVNDVLYMSVGHTIAGKVRFGLRSYGCYLGVDNMKWWEGVYSPPAGQALPLGDLAPYRTNAVVDSEVMDDTLAAHNWGGTPIIHNSFMPQGPITTVTDDNPVRNYWIPTPQERPDYSGGVRNRFMAGVGRSALGNSEGGHAGASGVIAGAGLPLGKLFSDGRIIGYVSNDTAAPVSREVRLHRRDTGELVQQIWSDQNGNYAFYGLDINSEYTVVAIDYANDYNAVIADRAIPEAY